MAISKISKSPTSIEILKKINELVDNSENIASGDVKATGNNTFTGDNTFNKAISVGTAIVYGDDTNVALGQDAIANPQSTYIVSIGANAQAYDNAVAVGANTYSVLNSVVIGKNAKSRVSPAVVIGADATASATSVVIGQEASTSIVGRGIAIGALAKAGDMETIAIGIGAKASYEHSFAFGTQSNTYATNQVSFASRSSDGSTWAYLKDLVGIKSVTLEAEPTSPKHVATKQYVDSKAASSVYLSDDNTFIGTNTFSKGLLAGTAAVKGGINWVTFGEGTVHVDNSTTIGAGATCSGINDSVAIGTNAVATGSLGIAIGTNAATSAANAIALGINSKAGASGAIAIGNGARSDKTYSVAIGRDSKCTANYQVSFAEHNGSEWVGSKTLVGIESVTLEKEPTELKHATTKGYVDTQIGQILKNGKLYIASIGVTIG